MVAMERQLGGMVPRYLLALAALAVATGLRWLLDPALGNHLPYVTYFVAIMFTAWACGLGPSVLALALGGWLADYFFYEPRYIWYPHSHTPEHLAGIASYVMVGSISVYICVSMREAQRRAQRIAHDARRMQETLRDNEERKAAVLESAIDCLITMDHEGRIVDFNPAAEETFGRSRADVVGQSVAETIIPPRLRQAHWEGLSRYLNTGEHRVLGQRIEMPALRADGTEFPVELSITANRAGSGPPFFTAFVRDITQRLRDQQQLQESLAQAENASRLKDEFLATLSHELRTPMTAILGWTHMLRQTTSGSSFAERTDDLAQGLEVIERNARIQSQIIEDLLDMSRIIAGKIRLDVQAVDVGAVTRAAVDAVRPAADAKRIRLQLIGDPTIKEIHGDPNRLQQVVYNLLTNAIKFTPKDGKVQVVCQRINSHIEISVSDTGIGIKPEFAPFLFERFRQQDASIARRFTGLGLGLAIVKQLVELHGGKVQAASEGEGKGSTFTIHLPVAIALPPALPEDASRREHPRASDAAGAASDDAAVSTDLSGLRILVVDDEPDARELLRRMLTAASANVFIASSAEQALEQLMTHRPHILISDIGMPIEDGYALIRRVRGLPSSLGGATPAIALTAFARSEDRTRAMYAGYNLHLAKPIEPAELIAGVLAAARDRLEPLSQPPHPH
jgi:PAS domain S-box-containing protein